MFPQKLWRLAFINKNLVVTVSAFYFLHWWSMNSSRHPFLHLKKENTHLPWYRWRKFHVALQFSLEGRRRIWRPENFHSLRQRLLSNRTPWVETLTAQKHLKLFVSPTPLSWKKEKEKRIVTNLYYFLLFWFFLHPFRPLMHLTSLTHLDRLWDGGRGLRERCSPLSLTITCQACDDLHKVVHISYRQLWPAKLHRESWVGGRSAFSMSFATICEKWNAYSGLGSIYSWGRRNRANALADILKQMANKSLSVKVKNGSNFVFRKWEIPLSDYRYFVFKYLWAITTFYFCLVSLSNRFSAHFRLSAWLLMGFH